MQGACVRALVSIALMIGVAGCDLVGNPSASPSDSERSGHANDISAHVLQKIEDFAGAEVSVEKVGEGYIVDGDIFLHQRLFDESSGVPTDKQAALGGGFGKVKYSNATTVRVRIGADIQSDPQWLQAVRDAMNAWNSVATSALTFTEVTSNPDLEIVQTQMQAPSVPHPRCTAGSRSIPEADRSESGCFSIGPVVRFGRRTSVSF